MHFWSGHSCSEKKIYISYIVQKKLCNNRRNFFWWYWFYNAYKVSLMHHWKFEKPTVYLKNLRAYSIRVGSSITKIRVFFEYYPKKKNQPKNGFLISLVKNYWRRFLVFLLQSSNMAAKNKENSFSNYLKTHLRQFPKPTKHGFLVIPDPPLYTQLPLVMC